MREPGFIKRKPRVATNVEASLIDSEGSEIAVVVTDINSEGCRLETDGSLKIGELVDLQVGDYGSFPAQIRWALGNDAGAAFLAPVILPEKLERS